MNGTKRRVRRIILGLLCLGILAAALALGISAYMVASTEDRVLSPEDMAPEGLDCILVLGCGIRADGSPTPMLADRISRAVELYEAGWADKIGRAHV